MSALSASRAQIVTGRVLSGLAIAFLTFDAGIKVLQLPPAVEGTTSLGYAASAVLGIGLLELACLALYALPATSILGAVLLTGYFGGAIASHARLGNPLMSHVLFPVYVAVLVWGGLYFRDARLRILVPIVADA